MLLIVYFFYIIVDRNLFDFCFWQCAAIDTVL